MPGGPPFVDRDVFLDMLSGVVGARGAPYEDTATIYGDLARLVVGWLATARTDELVRVYAEGGWGGSPNVAAAQKAAREWYRRYHPDRPPLE